MLFEVLLQMKPNLDLLEAAFLGRFLLISFDLRA